MLAAVPTSASEVIQVVEGKLKPEKSALYQKFEKLLGWADEVRRLGIRANADVPKDAKIAFGFGARGIGLCRTEHMFFGEDRLPYVVKMILAAARGQRGIDLTKRIKEQLKEAKGHRATELRKELAKVQKEFGKYIKDYTMRPQEARADAEGRLRRALQGDARLAGHHPHPRPAAARVPAEARGADGRDRHPQGEAWLQERRRSPPKEKLLRAVEELHEFNPMLGHRGCRLGITYPEITKMQAKAIFEAALQVSKKGIPVKPEVMIPLVGHVEELKRQKAIVLEAAHEVLGKDGSGVDYLIGTMIEVPRGAVTADEIAKEAEFFSFGTNDLTQMGFGLSRDDAGKFLLYYQEHGLIEKDPFVTLDAAGVGLLVRDRRQEGPQREAEAEDRRLRRARRRPVVDPVLPQGGPRLRVLLALPGADRPAGGGPGPARVEGERLAHLRGPGRFVGRDPEGSVRCPGGPGRSAWPLVRSGRPRGEACQESPVGPP